MTLLISLGSFLLGLFALRRIYVLERSAASSPLQLAFVYFLPQHIAFSFAVLLMAVFDQGYSYLTLHGSFSFMDGVVRLQLVNLVSLYAGLVGVRIAVIGRQPANRRQNILPPSEESGLPSKVLTGENRALWIRVCYISLAFHAFITGLQWYDAYNGLPTMLIYPIQVLAPIVLATFYFWGRWWPQAGHERLVFITYVSVFGLVQLVSGGRGTFLAGVLLFAIGYLQVRDWRLRRHELAVIAVCAVLLLWLITISENVRLLNPGRRPADMAEWLTRGGQLLGGVGSSGQGVESFSYAVFRSAASMTSFSPLDVVARTPEDISYAGWSEDDWYLLFKGLLPEFGMSQVVTAGNKGPIDLGEYGWLSDPRYGNAAPMTFLADSWRRFGIFGVIVAHFVWAMLLARFSLLVGQRGFSIYRLIFGGSLIAVTYHFFLWDILQLGSFLPRRVIVCLIYTTVVYAVYSIQAHRGRKLHRIDIGAPASSGDGYATPRGGGS